MRWGFFLCTNSLARKARERELATFDEKTTRSGIAEPYAREKSKASTGGEKGRHPVTTACPSGNESKSVRKKKVHAAVSCIY